MKQNMIAESLNTFETMCNVYNDIKSRAVSVFAWDDLASKIGVSSSYLERGLYSNGSMAFAYDKVMDKWLVSTFSVTKYAYPHGEPVPVQIRLNGIGATFNKGEFVIVYDTQSRTPLFPIIKEYCRRYAETFRTIDVNVHQQRTPRLTLVPENRLLSTKNVFAQADDYNDNIVGVADEFDVNKYNQFLNPAPLVFDKLNEYRHDLYNTMLGLIGITSMQADSKDRHVVDEVRFSNGGNFQSRFNRFTPRDEFIATMRDRYDIELNCKFYDNMPSTWEREEVSYNVEQSTTSDTEII